MNRFSTSIIATIFTVLLSIGAQFAFRDHGEVIVAATLGCLIGIFMMGVFGSVAAYLDRA